MLEQIRVFLNQAAIKVVLGFNVILLGYLFWISVTTKFPSDSSYYDRENPIWGIAALGAVLLVPVLVKRPLEFLQKRIAKTERILLLGTLFLTCGFTLVFMAGAKIMPSSDSYSVFEIVGWMADGDMRAVIPQGSYLSLWPFQCGLIFILECTMRITHLTHPIFYEGFNIGFIALALIAGYGIVKQYTDKLEIVLTYLIIAGTYFPLCFFSTRVYGDMPSLALMMFSAWMLLVFFKEDEISAKYKKWICCGLGCFSEILACTYRRNSLIYALAVLICAVLYLVLHAGKGRFRYWGIRVMIFVTTFLLAAGSTGMIQKLYEYRAGNICGDGVPATAYIAMGLHDDEEMPGKNNGFHTTTFMENNYDAGITAEISKEAIGERINYFMQHPTEMFAFFHRKTVAQWGNATSGCFWMIAERFGRPQEEYALDILYGEAHLRIVNYMNLHHSIMYGICFLGTILMMLRSSRIRFTLIDTIPLVTFMGGFLFSLIWEAGPRYVFAYPYLLLPFMIARLGRLISAKKADGRNDDEKD